MRVVREFFGPRIPFQRLGTAEVFGRSDAGQRDSVAVPVPHDASPSDTRHVVAFTDIGCVMRLDGALDTVSGQQRLIPG